MKRLLVCCALFCSGCDFPPEEAADIRQQLQARIASGQVYIIHSSEELSYVIKNSDFTARPDAEKEILVASIEQEALAVLAKYRNYKRIRIYFLGGGTRGIDSPYTCRASINACIKTRKSG